MFNLYAQAYTLKCEKLIKELTELISKKFLNSANSIHFLGFSVKFDNEKLKKACQEKLKNIFVDIKNIEARRQKEKEDQSDLEHKEEDIRTALNLLHPSVFAEIL